MSLSRKVAPAFAALAFGSLAASISFGGMISVDAVTGVITNGLTQLVAVSGTAPNGTLWASLVTGTNPVAYFDLHTGTLMFDPKGKNINSVDFRWGVNATTISNTTPGPYVFTNGSGQSAISTSLIERTMPSGTWSAITTFPSRLSGNVSLTNSPMLATSGGNIASTTGWFNQPWSFGAIAPTVTQPLMFSTTDGQGFRADTTVPGAGSTTNILGYGNGIGMFLYVTNPPAGRQYGPVVPVARLPEALAWAATGTTPGGSGHWDGIKWLDTKGLKFGWYAASKAVFTGTFSESLISVSEHGVSVGRGISFSSNGYTLKGGTVTLAGGSEALNDLFVDVGLAATINAPVTAPSGLLKSGFGTLVIGGTVVTSGLRIDAGTLEVGTGGTNGSITVDITNNGSLRFNRSDTVTYGGMISGTGSLTKLGGGMLTLTGSHSYTGATTISAGTVQIANAAALTSTPVAVESGAILSINTAGTMQAPSLTLKGSGQAILPTTSRQIVSLGSLSIDQAAGGRIDIGKGRIEIAPGGISEADLRAALITGRGIGTFAAANFGIVTSAPNPATFMAPVIGYSVLPSGVTVVAWSAFGDSNLNGRVDFDDVLQFVAAGGYDTGLPAAWSDGDFDYNGVVDFDDIRAFVAQGLYDKGSYLPPPLAPSVMAASGAAAVPEPSAWAMRLAGLMALAAWRRRAA